MMITEAISSKVEKLNERLLVLRDAGVSTGDIKSVDDLFKIPLIPDLTFKQHPEGKDFGLSSRYYKIRSVRSVILHWMRLKCP